MDRTQPWVQAQCGLAICGRVYLFGYYEYIGTDYNADMAKLAAEPRNQKWLSVAGPMQVPLPGEQSWALMKEVYHNP